MGSWAGSSELLGDALLFPVPALSCLRRGASPRLRTQGLALHHLQQPAAGREPSAARARRATPAQSYASTRRKRKKARCTLFVRYSA